MAIAPEQRFRALENERDRLWKEVILLRQRMSSNWEAMLGVVSGGWAQEELEDIVGAMVSGNTETFITVSYEDDDGTLDFVVPVLDEDNLGSDSDVHLATQQSIKAYVDSAIATDERIQDVVGAMVSGNTETGIAVTYQDGDGTLDFVVDPSGIDLDDLANTTLADPDADRIVFWDDDAGVYTWLVPNTGLEIDGTNLNCTVTDTNLSNEEVQDIVGAMVSGNTETGIAVTYQDGDGTLDFVVSTEWIQDLVGAMVSGNTETLIAVSYEDGDGTLDFVVDEASIDHDALTNFVADEHVAHSGVTITAGAGLTGTHNIASPFTLAVGAGDGITVNADDVALTTPGTLTAATSNAAAGNHTHAITDTSDGASNHSTILSSSAAGAITMDDYFTIDGGTVGISGNEMLVFHAAGTITVSGANLDLNGNDLLIDADADSYLHASADDVVDLVLAGASGEFAININGAEDFKFTANAFSVLSGSGINMADATWIGISGNELLTVNAGGNFTFSGIGSVVVPNGCWVGADANASWVFDTSNSDVTTQDKVGVGTAAPVRKLQVEESSGNPTIWIKNTNVFLNTFDQSQQGILLTAAGADLTYKWGPGVMFGSTDSAFTTTNPKWLAGIFPVVTETYAADTDSGMALAFFATADNAGVTPTPTECMRIGSSITAIGASQAVSGSYAAALGGTANTVSGSYAVSLGGTGAVAAYRNQMAFSGGKNDGDISQSSWYQVKKDADHSNDSWNYLACATGEYPGIPNDTVIHYTARVVGTTEGAAEEWIFSLSGAVKNVNGDTSTIAGTASVTTITETGDDEDFECQVAVGGAGSDEFYIQVRDANGSGDLVHWSAVISFVESQFD